jgi:hypothetical protein
MNIRSRFLLALAGLLTLAAATPALHAAPTADDIVARARAHVGLEDDLNGLTSIVYDGTMYDSKGQNVGSIVMKFKKPRSQRSEFISANGTEIEATDGYEGWALGIDNSGQKKMAIIMAPKLASYIDTSFENLYFFRGPLQRYGGTINYAGTADFQGAHCYVLTFNYPNGLVFTRYFDQQSYQLIGTLTDDGHTLIIESGSLLVNHVTFPTTIQSFSDGKLVRTMKFDKIQINVPLDDSQFDVPDTSVLLPTPGAVSDSGSAAPADSNSALGPAATPVPTASNNSINVPPATPQPNEQPLMFNIKPGS